MIKNFKPLLPLLIIFSLSCATEAVTEEVDPASRETNFTLSQPENEPSTFLPMVTNKVPTFFACLFILFVLWMSLFLCREKHSQLASASVLTLFALFVLSCTATVTEQVTREASLDPDGDNLINVSNIEQLNAVRFDLDGDGTPTGTAADTLAYRTAYGIVNDGDGCDSCVGYELTRSLDFQDEDSYQADTVNTAYTTGTGWLPIGDNTNGFSADFNGNRFRISNLFIDRPKGTGNERYVGLFGEIASEGVVRFLGVSDVNVEGEQFIGGLAGSNTGTITNCYATGSLESVGRTIAPGNTVTLGGLVGLNRGGSINNSYTDASLRGEQRMGGLVGENSGSLNNSWSSGSVTSMSSRIGSLVGVSFSRVDNSYSLSQVSSTGGSVGGLLGEFMDGEIENSYAGGMVTGEVASTGGLVGILINGTITGVNYFADDDGTNGIGLGIGGGTCAATVCIQATGATFTDRQTWLRDTLDETDDAGLNWDAQLDAGGNPVWGDLNRSGVFPCLMNMPEGAPPCPAAPGTVHLLP